MSAGNWFASSTRKYLPPNESSASRRNAVSSICGLMISMFGLATLISRVTSVTFSDEDDGITKLSR